MLTITRDTGYADKLRSYQIELDGQNVGAINDGEILTLPLEAGDHSLVLRIDWGRSNKAQFTSNANEEIQFHCASALRGWNAILAVVYATVLRSRYIILKQTS